MPAQEATGMFYREKLTPTHLDINDKFVRLEDIKWASSQSPFRLWAVSQKSSFQSVTLAFMLPMRFKNAAK